MKKILLSLLGIIVCFSVCGCAGPLEAHTSSGKPLEHERFRIVEGNIDSQAILVDTETGVEYLWISEYSRAGLTVIVDHEGKPLIAPGFKDY